MGCDRFTEIYSRFQATASQIHLWKSSRTEDTLMYMGWSRTVGMIVGWEADARASESECVHTYWNAWPCVCRILRIEVGNCMRCKIPGITPWGWPRLARAALSPVRNVSSLIHLLFFSGYQNNTISLSLKYCFWKTVCRQNKYTEKYCRCEKTGLKFSF